MMEMFCYQCQETAQNKGCTIKGVCGKEAITSNMMDTLLYALRGEAIVNSVLREKGCASKEASIEILQALFCTITNANFDDESIKCYIDQALMRKNELIGTAKKREIALPEMAELGFHPEQADYEKAGERVGVKSIADVNVRSLKELCIYGVKGAAAYAHHAHVLGMDVEPVCEMIETTLAQVSPILCKSSKEYKLDYWCYL